MLLVFGSCAHLLSICGRRSVPSPRQSVEIGNPSLGLFFLVRSYQVTKASARVCFSLGRCVNQLRASLGAGRPTHQTHTRRKTQETWGRREKVNFFFSFASSSSGREGARETKPLRTSFSTQYWPAGEMRHAVSLAGQTVFITRAFQHALPL